MQSIKRELHIITQILERQFKYQQFTYLNQSLIQIINNFKHHKKAT